MMCRQIIVVCSQVHTEHINTLRGLNAKLGSTKSNHGALGRLTKHTNLTHVTRTAKSLYYQLVIKFLKHIEIWQSGGMAPIIINVGTHTGGLSHGPAVFIHSKESPVYYDRRSGGPFRASGGREKSLPQPETEPRRFGGSARRTVTV